MSYMVFAGACGWAALVERSGEVMGTMIKVETKLPDNLLIFLLNLTQPLNVSHHGLHRIS